MQSVRWTTEWFERARLLVTLWARGTAPSTRQDVHDGCILCGMSETPSNYDLSDIVHCERTKSVARAATYYSIRPRRSADGVPGISLLSLTLQRALHRSVPQEEKKDEHDHLLPTKDSRSLLTNLYHLVSVHVQGSHTLSLSVSIFAGQRGWQQRKHS